MNNKIVKEILEKKFKKSIFSGYDPFDVDHFFDQVIIYINDMLEIRDTLKTPILMLENKAKDGTFFIIPAVNGIIYEGVYTFTKNLVFHDTI